MSVQNIVLAASAWGVFSLLFFLLFSVSPPNWYATVTYGLEEVAFLGATALCFRNWRSSQIVSGRVVWFLLGAGMLSYFIGNLLLMYWELVLQKEPAVSPGDLFYLSTYIFLGIGMLLAVSSRRLNLTIAQYFSIAAIVVIGAAIAYFTSIAVPEEVEAPAEPAAIETVQPTSPSESPIATPPAVAPDLSSTEAPSDAVSAPGWAIAAENVLAPLETFITWLYIIGDLFLVVMATALLLAFWGGRFSLSWRFIAAAAFCFYIADIWFNYATSYIADYETGALPEVFWVFSGVLVSIGAALEYDLSTRSRRGARRRS